MIRQSPTDPFPFSLPTPPKMQPLDISTQYQGNDIVTRAQTPGVPVHTQPFDDLLRYMFKQRPQGPMGPPKDRRELGSKGGPDPVRRTAGNWSAGADAVDTGKLPGRFEMNQTGNWGTHVLPGRGVPAGFYGSAQNWDTSNPMILGATPYGKVDPGGGGGSLGSIGQSAGRGTLDPNPNGTGADFERQRLAQARALSDASYARSLEERG